MVSARFWTIWAAVWYGIARLTAVKGGWKGAVQDGAPAPLPYPLPPEEFSLGILPVSFDLCTNAAPRRYSRRLAS